jgi:hypothetical protein
VRVSENAEGYARLLWRQVHQALVKAAESGWRTGPPASRCLCRRLRTRGVKGSPCRNQTRRRQWLVADRIRDARCFLLLRRV